MSHGVEPSCPFCEIVAGRAPAQVLRNWGDCLAIVPLNPVTAGHSLVIPTMHVDDALALPKVTGLVMARAAEYAAWQGAPGYNLITSVGAVATQTVMHLHVHVVPRRAGDGLALPWTEHGHLERAQEAERRLANAREMVNRLRHAAGGGMTPGYALARIEDMLNGQEPT